MLQAVGISAPDILAFVRQNTEALFKNRPIFRKLANTVTDIAAIASAGAQIHRNLQRKVESFVRTKKVGKKIRKFFGGALVAKMKVAQLKAIVKANRAEFGRKILVSKMRKAELVSLVEELHDKGIVA